MRVSIYIYIYMGVRLLRFPLFLKVYINVYILNPKPSL